MKNPEPKKVTALDVRRNFMRVLDGSASYHEHVLHLANGREFGIIELSPETFYPFELRLSGASVKKENGKDVFRNHAELIELADNNPNGIADYCRTHGIDVDTLCRFGGGLSLIDNHRHFDTFEEACAEIANSINENKPYNHTLPARELSEVQKLHAKRKELIDSQKYWTEQKNEAGVDAGFMKSASNMFGAISKESQTAILSYINNPTEQAWKQIYFIIISGEGGTLWKAWGDYCPHAPKSKPLLGGWSCIPTGEELTASIRAHLDGRQQKIRDRLDEIQRELEKVDDSLKLSDASGTTFEP